MNNTKKQINNDPNKSKKCSCENKVGPKPFNSPKNNSLNSKSN